MTQVNLLPPELRAREATRRQTGLVVLVGLVLIGLIGVFYFLQVLSLSHAQDDLAAQEGVNAQLQAQVRDLQQFAELQNQLAARQQLLATVFTDEVSWSGVLVDVSRIIPSDGYLTSLTGSIGGPSATAPTSGPTIIGSMSFAGVMRQTDPLATWLTRLEQVNGWVNAWLSSATESAPFSKIYTFDSGIDLTANATTQRGRAGP
jgi:Tfp pilus assembly protein PilN